jgi:hypothetical protein
MISRHYKVAISAFAVLLIIAGAIASAPHAKRYIREKEERVKRERECSEARQKQQDNNDECIRKGGQPGYGPMMWCGYVASGCQYPFADGGKNCSSSNECQGGCLGEMGDSSGVCSTWLDQTRICVSGTSTIDGLKIDGLCY